MATLYNSYELKRIRLNAQDIGYYNTPFREPAPNMRVYTIDRAKLEREYNKRLKIMLADFVNNYVLNLWTLTIVALIFIIKF